MRLDHPAHLLAERVEGGEHLGAAAGLAGLLDRSLDAAGVMDRPDRTGELAATHGLIEIEVYSLL